MRGELLGWGATAIIYLWRFLVIDWRALANSCIFDRAFADFVLGSLILHFFCVNFIN